MNRFAQQSSTLYYCARILHPWPEPDFTQQSPLIRGAWLHTLPVRSLGLALTNRELRVAVALRIGAPLTRKHACICGVEVDPLGHHGLSCREGAARGRQRRHAQAIDILVRALSASDVRAELESHLMQRDDGKMRPDGATLDPWTSGRILVWDFTCPDTLAASYVNQSAASAGSAAARAEQIKRTKYVQLMQSEGVLFTPIAIETLGTWGPAAV